MKTVEQGDVPSAGVAGLFAAQRAFFASGRTNPLSFRKTALKRLEAELERRVDEILGALDSDLGKPPLEAYVSEYHFTISEIRLFLRKLGKWARPRRVRNPFFYWPAQSEIRREPKGTALVVSTWNYPVQLSLSPLIAAVAAGNVVVLKPSETAPATARILEEVIRASFDPGHVNVIQGGPEVGQALMDQPFDHWFFTGSSRIGKLYAEAAARHLAPATLELGGKCPCIVDRDIDLDRTVERIVTTKFFNAGQTCMAPDFVLVPESIREEFVNRAEEMLRRCYSQPFEGQLARIINDEHYRRLRDLIPEDALRIGEDRPAERFLAPTLIPRASWNSPAMQEEIFGPVLPVIGYRDLEETLGQLAALPSPLALYAFSRKRQTLEKIAGSIRSGSVCFNDAIKQATNLQLPFGGVGPSGMGRYRGRSGFETFSYQRSVTRRWFSRDPFLNKPPYDNQLERLRKILR